MRTAKWIVALLIVLSGFFFKPAEMFACSCVGGDALVKKERSTNVFQGEVVNIGKRVKGEFAKLRQYTFDVELVWKGEPKRRIILYSYDGDSASCGLSFEAGERYLIYAYAEEDGRLVTNLCSGNLKLAEADEDLKLLGPGTEVPEEPDSYETKQTNSTPAIPAILIILTALLVLGAYISLKSRNTE